MDARESVDYFIGGDRGGRGERRVSFFLQRAKGNQFFEERNGKRGSPLSHPGTRNRLFPFFA